MAIERGAAPLASTIRCSIRSRSVASARRFATSSTLRLEADTVQSDSTFPPLPSTSDSNITHDPNRVSTARSENRLLRTQNKYPIGSRRRRAALAQGGLPLSQQPYQCFQEARKFLQEDRKEKVEAIQAQQERIRNLQSAEVAPQNEAKRENKLRSLRKAVHENVILADINDPLVKKKFEDGQGDLSKPIYRHLADLKWRSYERKLLMQRIEQMHVIPDLLPGMDPIVSTQVIFGRKKIRHGDFVDSLVSERAPRLNVQCYDKGARKVTIAVINADVPDVANDGYTYRCHFLASNVEISPTNPSVDLSELDETSQVILPWLPAYSQKGLAYSRMAVFVLQQTPNNKPLETPTHTVDVQATKEAGKYTQRHKWNLRSFVDKQLLTPVGVDLFRSQWDENTAGVMQRAEVTGWDVEFKRKRVEPLPYQRKDSVRYR